MNQPIIKDLPQQNIPSLIGVPKLAQLAFDGDDMSQIGEELLARIGENQFDVNALMDIALVLLLRGQPEAARVMRQLAIGSQPLYHYPRPTMPIKLRLLALYGPGDLMANSPLEFLLEGQPVALDLLHITPERGMPETVPEHDVLMVAVAESDQNQALLAQLERDLANWPRPVINRAARIRALSRDGVCQQLGGLPGVVMPPTLRVSHTQLQACCHEGQDASALSQKLPSLAYPIILRPIDSHAGSSLSRIKTPTQLMSYLDDSDERNFYISNFVDYRSADGKYRKFRIMLIDGTPYVSHMAVSSRWMVHYLNADMLESAAHRDEEARFMESFASGFAQRHAQAIAAIAQQLDLAYVGMDCAETPDGKLLVFEADSNMVVHNMDGAEKFAYKKVWMPKLFDAFTAMLLHHAASGSAR